MLRAEKMAHSQLAHGTENAPSNSCNGMREMAFSLGSSGFFWTASWLMDGNPAKRDRPTGGLHWRSRPGNLPGFDRISQRECL
jgi:hypothetical protein